MRNFLESWYINKQGRHIWSIWMAYGWWFTKTNMIEYNPSMVEAKTYIHIIIDEARIAQIWIITNNNGNNEICLLRPSATENHGYLNDVLRHIRRILKPCG